MSDPGAGPDPMDKAYVEAEAVLDDDAARAARRARLLAAVTREPVMAPTASAPSLPRSPWRVGRWLAAACVAGLAVLVAIQTYRPIQHQPHIAPAVPAAPTSAAPSSAAPTVAASPAPPAPAASEAPAPPALAAQAASATPPAVAKAEPPPPPPPTFAAAPQPQAFAAKAARAPPPPPSSVVATAERRESAVQPAPVAVSAFTSQSRAAQAVPSDALAGLQSDRAASLRAAAAAGRTADVEALLTQGVAVDAPDAGGDTALMKSIQADQPAAAALLRRHGASLDRKNQAGQSARDMAKAKGDAALDQAIGLAP